MAKNKLHKTPLRKYKDGIAKAYRLANNGSISVDTYQKFMCKFEIEVLEYEKKVIAQAFNDGKENTRLSNRDGYGHMNGDRYFELNYSQIKTQIK